tara:strand:+ start:1018 stop:1764 length:747 start_codon:yes stop_codon:yes gene_type:complete
MNYKILLFFFSIFFVSCENQSKKINYKKNFINYSNKGFTLIYDKKLVKKKMDDRSLLIFNKFLDEDTPVKVTNLINGKYLLAKVGKKSNYPDFYNSVVSKRIAENLDINSQQPYVEIRTLSHNNSFVINKAKTFDEEKKVANKVPVQGIEIKNLSNTQLKKKKIQKKLKLNLDFKYIIKIADLYFHDSAKILKNRLENEYNIKNIKIKKMSKNNYRIYLGPFNNLDSIKRDYIDIDRLNFENIEIIKL